MYKIYPTLLDSWVNYKLGRWVTEIDLIRKLSRIKWEPSAAALKGIGLEECVNNTEPYYYAQGNYYPKHIVDDLRSRVKGGAIQEFIKFNLTLQENEIEFYGYVDYILANKIVDLKYTGKYIFPKFSQGMQHHVYLLGASLNNMQADNFVYLVSDLKEIYEEHYSFNKDESINTILTASMELIEFAHKHENKILDRKFFGA